MEQAVSSAVVKALEDLLDMGELIETASGKSWLELSSYTTGMTNPQRRIHMPAVGVFDIVGAAGRFLWMMRGDDSLSSIAYYVTRAADFSADGISLVGSGYGRRLRRSSPGVDQVIGVIHRLRTSPETRQAATVIWDPMDAIREPIDVPCAFGTLYHRRSGGLRSTTLMRSNKPLTLMAFNFFEFSMLAEVIAAELSIPLAPYTHWIGAMQLPSKDVSRARAIREHGAESVEMPAVPVGEGALAEVTELSRLEERLRYASSSGELDGRLGKARDTMHPYWIAFADLLALRWFVRRDDVNAALRWAERLPEYFAVPALAYLRAVANC